MKPFNYYKVATFLFFIFLNACQESTIQPDPSVLGLNYFPLEINNFIEYDVTETSYTVTGTPNINIYQLRELVADTFTDLSKRQISYRLERYKRSNSTSLWALDSVWYARKTTTQALKTESNITYVKLIFPLKEKQTWDGNEYNSLGKDDYLMKDLAVKYTLNNFVFDKSLKIVQADDSSLVKVDRRNEAYAEGVGLIYKELRQINYCAETACIGKGQITFGKIKIQKIRNYGKI